MNGPPLWFRPKASDRTQIVSVGHKFTSGFENDRILAVRCFGAKPGTHSARHFWLKTAKNCITYTKMITRNNLLTRPLYKKLHLVRETTSQSLEPFAPTLAHLWHITVYHYVPF